MIRQTTILSKRRAVRIVKDNFEIRTEKMCALIITILGIDIHFYLLIVIIHSELLKH